MNPLRRREHGSRRGVRRAVVLMPNGLTLFNLFCGIYAIILAVHKQIAAAPGFILLGGIADTLDGRVARATGTGSRFGEELDSLVDAISFGFAPALIVFLARPVDSQASLDWLLVFIFTACAVMRLARFNVEQAGRKKTHFHGLPSPAAGLTLATYYWFAQTPLYNQTVILFTDSRTLATLPWDIIMRGLMAILAALMVSDVPYPAVPSIGFNSLRKILGTLAILASVLLLVLRREEFIFPALLAYVAYGIVKWMILGFIGRSSTPDEIFWEQEAELHAEDERRSAFDRPHLTKDALEDIDDEEDSRPRPRERSRRDGRREERRPKRRDSERRESRRDEAREARRDEAREEKREKREKTEKHEERRRDEPKRDRERPRRPESQVSTESRSLTEPVAVEAPTEPVTPDGAPTEERREPGRQPDDEVQRRKRRRRRGRGSRSRGERNGEASAANADASGGESGGDSHGESHNDSHSDSRSESFHESRGDNPPGPSLPDTPTPSGPAE